VPEIGRETTQNSIQELALPNAAGEGKKGGVSIVADRRGKRFQSKHVIGGVNWGGGLIPSQIVVGPFGAGGIEQQK